MFWMICKQNFVTRTLQEPNQLRLFCDTPSLKSVLIEASPYSLWCAQLVIGFLTLQKRLGS